jgi:hypothetical protein
MLLKLVGSHFAEEHMRKQCIIDPHLVGTLRLNNIEDAAIDDEGVMVGASGERSLLSLMKDFPVNG